MGKKSKSKKSKIKVSKTTERNLEERQGEIITLQKKLDELQLGPDSVPEINDFFNGKVVNEYIELGVPADGCFPLPGYKRILHYRLTSKKMHQVTMQLKFNETI